MRKPFLIRSLILLVSVAAGIAASGAAGLRAQSSPAADSAAPEIPGNAKSPKFSPAALRTAKGYVESGNIPAAISYLSEASRLQETAGGKPIVRIPILLELENLYTRTKDLSGIEVTRRRLLDTWTAAFGPDELVVANNAEALASALSNEGKEEQAVQFRDQALAIIQKALGPNHSATEYALTQLIDEEKKREAINPRETTRLSELNAELRQVKAARDAERPAIKAERAGKEVSAPRVITQKDPEYSKLARKLRLSGFVLLGLVVGADGIPVQIEVLTPLGLGLDEAAVAGVSQWVFQPGMKAGVPVAVKATVEVNFRLL